MIFEGITYGTDVRCGGGAKGRVATEKNREHRGVAQFGSALGSGPRGRGFKSRHLDQLRNYIAAKSPEKLSVFQDSCCISLFLFSRCFFGACKSPFNKF